MLDDFNLEFFQGDILTRTNLIVKLGLPSRISSNVSCGPRSAHIHFILKRKLKFFLQRQVKFCRFEVKFCRFSLHTLHLERKVEVFLAGSEAGSAHILFILIEVFPAGAARSADQRVQGSTSPDHLIS